MDIVNLLIHRDKIDTVCCLCFRHDEKAMDIFQDVNIQDENGMVTSTVFSMIKFSCPLQVSHDLLLNQACNDCVKLIISMYLTLQRHLEKVKIFGIILNKLQKEVENNSLLLSQKHVESCRLEIDTANMSAFKNNNEIFINFVRCENCDMEFQSKELLQQHSKFSHCNANAAIVCHICGKVFKTPHSLKSHLNCHNEKVCPYCNKKLKSHSHYKLHLKNHTKKTRRIRKKNYCCNDCNYMTIDKASLEAHINRIHLNKRPHVCNVCFKGYFKKKTLAEHVKTHNELRNVTCEVCGDNFLHKKSLFDHLRLHTGEKPYECEFCEVKFVTNGRRWEHVKRKHMEKTELCLICNKKYSMKNELKRHMEKVHRS